MARVHRQVLDPLTGQELLVVDGVPGASVTAVQGSLATRRDAVTGAAVYVRLASSWELIAGSGGGGGLTGTLTSGAVPYATGTSSLADSLLSIVSGRVHSNGELRTTGSLAGFTAYDRSTGVTNAWETYVTSDIYRIYSFSTASDRLTLTTGGVLTATSFVGSGASLTNVVNTIDGASGAFTLGTGLSRASLVLSVANLPWSVITSGVPAFAQVNNSNAFTSTNTFANTTTFNGGAVFNGQFTVNTAALFSLGAESLQIKAAASDHTFIGFYARTATQSTRTGYFGFGSSGGSDMTMANETASGILNFRAKGVLGAQIADTGVWCDAYRRANGNRMIAYQATSYTVLYDASDRAALYLGNTGDPRNYYDNTNHRWRDAAGSATQMELSTTGLTLPGTFTGAGQMTVNRAGSASEVTVANFVNGFSGLTGLYINCNGVSGTSGIVKLYATGDTNKQLQILTGNDLAIQVMQDRSMLRFFNSNGRIALRGDTDGNQGVWLSNDESTWFFGRTGGDGVRFFRSGVDVATVTSAGITAIDFILSSDSRLKANVMTLTDATARLSRIRGISYLMRGRKEVGVLAQEVREVLPEAVHQGQDGYYGVAYERLVPLLIESLKHAHQRITVLEAQRGYAH